MELKAILENGDEVELSEIKTIDKDCETIIMMSKNLMHEVNVGKFEKEMTEKIGKNVVLIPPFVKDIIQVS